MADIFFDEENNNTFNQINEQSRKAFGSENEIYDKKDQQYLQDLQKYQVYLPQQQYDIINTAIANAEIPEDEAYRWASALELSNQYGIDTGEAYQNLEQIIAAKWGEEYKYTPKTAFKAIVDSGKLGVNTLKQGNLGLQIMAAELSGGENLTELLDKYYAIEKENEGLYDYMDRNIVIEALKFGAQSAPFTGYVAGMGILGSLLAPGVGTAASFTASMANATGLQYMSLRKDGSEIGAATGLSLVSGGLEAVVEVALGNVAGALGKNALGNSARKAISEKITSNVFKRLNYNGTMKSLAGKLAKEYLKENFEEGMEEVVQDLIEKGTTALAAELGNYDIDGVTATEIARSAWENFYGGVLGSLVLGLPTSAIKVRSEVKEFKRVRDLAEEIPSTEVFKKMTENSPIFNEMDEEEKSKWQSEIHKNVQDQVDAELNLKAKEYGEVIGTEGFEEEVTDEETGDTVIEPEYRNDETGMLHYQNVVNSEEDGVIQGTFAAGDPTKENSNKYAKILYTQDKNTNTVTIDEFKVGKIRRDLRGEIFDNFARTFPGMNIEWNAKGKIAQEWKVEFEEANPQGQKQGLNYYASSDDIADIEKRKEVVKSIKQAYKTVGKTLTNKQLAADVVILESLYRRLREQQDFKDRGINTFNDYINYTFGNQMFGDASVATERAQEQFASELKKGGKVIVQGAAKARTLQELDRNIKSIIYVTENGDFSTFSHEIAHIARKQLTGDLLKQVEASMGVENGVWTEEKEEKFAFGFEQFLREGKAENEELKSFYEKIAQFLVDVFNKLKNVIEMTPDIENTYNELLSKADNSVLAAASNAVKEEAITSKYAELARQRKENAMQQEEIKQQQQEEANLEEAESEVTLDEDNNVVEDNKPVESEENKELETTLEETNLNVEEQFNTAEVLNDPVSSLQEKTEVANEAAASAYSEKENTDNDEVVWQHWYETDEEYAKAQEDAKNFISEYYDEKEAARILKNMKDLQFDENNEETGWYNMAVESALIQRDLRDLMDGKDFAENSWILAESKNHKTNSVYDMLKEIAKEKDPERRKQKAKKRIEKYFDKWGMIGNAGKAEKAVNASILNCDPSKGCAKFCYVVANASKYKEFNSSVKSELVNWYVTNYPVEAAERTAYEYEKYQDDGYALRLFDKGDLTEKWLPYVEALNNTHKLRTQIFTKRGELAMKLNPTANNLLLSIDTTNKELADKYPLLRLSVVYGGKQDLDTVKKYKDRVGVLLAVKENNKHLPTAVVNEAREELVEKKVVCPVDEGKVSSNTWKCLDCQNACIGCWTGDKTKAGMKDLLHKSDSEIIKAVEQQGVYLREANYKYIEKHNLHGPALQEYIDSVADMAKELATLQSQCDAGRIREGFYGTDGSTSTGHDGLHPDVRLDNGKINYQIIGLKGATALDDYEEVTKRIDNKNIAEQMEADGKDAKAIRMATGWEKGVDGQWRYEIKDFSIKDLDQVYKNFINYNGKHAIQLGQLLDGEGLFAAYPMLKNMTLMFENIKEERGRNYAGYYTEVNGFPAIVVDNEYYEALSEDNVLWEEDDETGEVTTEDLRTTTNLRSTLIHEIQHAIQSIEGFARGGTGEYARKLLKEQIKNKNNVTFKNEIAYDQIENVVGKRAAVSYYLNTYRYNDLEKFRKSGAYLEYGPFVLPKEETARKEALELAYEKWNYAQRVVVNELTNSWDRMEYQDMTESELDKKYKELTRELNSLYEKSGNYEIAKAEIERLDNFTDMELYKRIAGEVEARNAEFRALAPIQYRRDKLLAQTEDVAREDQILLFQTELEDQEYLNAVNAGNIEKAKEMLLEKATANGYIKQSYFGEGSWAAPTAGVEKDEFTDLKALQNYVDDYGDEVNIYGIINGVQAHQEDYYFNPTRVGFTGQAAVDTSQVYRKLKYDKAGPETEITVYRAVPNNVKGKKLLAGDWIALSKTYCEEHGKNRYGENGFHIIEQEVPISNIWQGSEDMREFGYDDGNKDVEKNIPNNRKLLEITYDKNGKLIPLSERFNSNISSILFQTAYHGSAADFEKFNTDQYGLSGEGSMSFGYGTYVTGSEEIARDYAQRQWYDKAGNKAYLEEELKRQEEDLVKAKEDYNNFQSYDDYKAEIEARIAKYENFIQKKKEEGVSDFITQKALERAKEKLNEEAYNKLKDQAKNAISYVEKEIADLKTKIAAVENNKDLKRNLYTIDIPDNGFIKWEKNVRRSTINKVKEALFRKLAYEPDMDGEFPYKGVENELRRELNEVFNSDYEGRSLYGTIASYLGSEKNASKFLNDLGYVGIDYPAGTNFGSPEKDARNYVIFDDSDAKIIEHLQYQTQEELYSEARTFDTWQEFMEFYEVMGRPEVTPIPYDADAQWYQTTWELANKVTPEESINEAIVEDKKAAEGTVPAALDSLFVTNVVMNDEALLDFLETAASYAEIDLNSDEYRNAATQEEAQDRERISDLQDYMKTIMYSRSFNEALNALKAGHEVPANVLKNVRGEMRDNFKSRDFRALYAEVMGDEQYAVDEADSITSIMNERRAKNPERYYDIVKPEEDISRYSPEKRKQIALAMDNADLAAKVKSGKLKMNDEVNNYIKSLDKEIAGLKKDLRDQEIEQENDFKRIADAERRELLKLHDKMLLAKAAYNKATQDEVNRKINRAIRTTSKYKRESQNLKANYDELFRKFNDLKTVITLDAQVQEALKRQEKIHEIKEEVQTKQQEKSRAAEEKKLRIQLVKRTMRRIDFSKIDYEDAKTIIAIQRLFEPNLLGGVNRWIGTEGPFLRGVISGILTDVEYKEEIEKYLRKNAKSSQQFADFMTLLHNTTSLEDFNKWTQQQRKQALRYLPKENWIRDLNLMKLAKEREESIDLDIDTVEVQKPLIDEKTGKVKTYKNEDGDTVQATVTGWKLQYSDEIAQRVQDAIGADMFNDLINVPFADWTYEQLEELATRINALYKQGRDLLEGKKIARKEAADAIRQQIETAVKNTGIIINDDDDDETKKRKQEKINKILGLTGSNTKGSDTSKDTGFKARLNRLLHSYNDANVLRVARILDGYTEGTNVQELYRKEDTCYINKTRSMNERAARIQQVMKENNITPADLATIVKVEVPSYDTVNPILIQEYTIDDLLYFAAAAEDYELKDNGMYDDFAACSKNAVMYGNMFASAADLEAKQAIAQDDEVDETGASMGLKQYIVRCNTRFEKVLEAAKALDPKYQALAAAIAEDYAAQYDRMNKVSVEQFNSPVHRVKAYVPLNRLESNGDTNINKVREDLLAAMGANATKQGVNKGMTARRVRINPLNQKPVVTGLYKTWADSVERTEHFIAYAEYVNELNRVYKNRDANYTRQFIENRYGKGMLRYIDDYINEVANPNANKVREAGAELLHTLRGRTAPAYLAWKASAIVKQGLTSPWPFMQYINPAEYAAASWKAVTSHGKLYDAIREKSVYMNNRVMDPMNDMIDEMAEHGKTKFDRFMGKQSQIGMAGLEWIDWVCVAPGWYAAYTKKYAELNGKNQNVYEAVKARLEEENAFADYGTTAWKTAEQIEAEAMKAMEDDVETRAVQYADDITRACQPSNRSVDISPLFKNSSEAMKAYLQFQTSLNVIWQNIRYDIPYAIKKQQFLQIAGCIVGYALAGIFMNSVMDGLPDDDEDKLKALTYYATTQFTDAVPMIGSELTNTMDKLITGKQQFMNSGTDMTPTATKVFSILTNAKKGNWEKAAEMTTEGIGMYLGLPVSGMKEVGKLTGIGDLDSEAGIHLDKVYGILDKED